MSNQQAAKAKEAQAGSQEVCTHIITLSFQLRINVDRTAQMTRD